jgi:hypothetical protein
MEEMMNTMNEKIELLNRKLDIVILSMDGIYKMLVALPGRNRRGARAEFPPMSEDFVQDVLTLPKPLQETITALKSTGNPFGATAHDISLITMKQRAVESSLLNELVRSGRVVKRRQGRHVYFKLTEGEDIREHESVDQSLG